MPSSNDNNNTSNGNNHRGYKNKGNLHLNLLLFLFGRSYDGELWEHETNEMNLSHKTV